MAAGRRVPAPRRTDAGVSCGAKNGLCGTCGRMPGGDVACHGPAGQYAYVEADDAAGRARQRELVRRGYDAISLAYRSDDGQAASSSAEDVSRYRGWVAELAGLLPAGARVLDLGCGAGIPPTRELVAHGLQGLLQRVLGVLGRTEDPVTVHLQFAPVRPHEITERLRGPGPGRRDQFRRHLANNRAGGWRKLKREGSATASGEEAGRPG